MREKCAPIDIKCHHGQLNSLDYKPHWAQQARETSIDIPSSKLVKIEAVFISDMTLRKPDHCCALLQTQSKKLLATILAFFCWLSVESVFQE